MEITIQDFRVIDVHILLQKIYDYFVLQKSKRIKERILYFALLTEAVSVMPVIPY